MRIRRASRWTVMVLIAACMGCSRFSVESDFDPAANFRTLRTYAWKPGPRPSIGDPRVSDALVDRTVRAAVDRDLGAKGYTPASPEDADFLLAYDAGIDFKTSTVAITRTTNAVYGAWVPSQHLQSSDYEQGVMVLLIFSRPTGELIWRGVATGIFDPTAASVVREQRITDVTHKLLKEFPPH
jgi:hypothetical protein